LTQHTINTARQLSNCYEYCTPLIQPDISQTVVNTAHL